MWSGAVGVLDKVPLVGRRKLGLWSVGLVVLAASAVMAAAAQARVATESTGVQVDAQHSGYVYGAGVVPPLTKAWSDDLNWRNEYVAIDGGHVFAVESSGGGKDALASIDLGSGEVTWSAALGDVFGSNVNLVVDSGRVFTATAISSPGAGGYVLAAWNEQTGAMIWSDRVSTFYDVEAAPPIVDNGVLHFVFGGNAFAVRETDGKVLWSTNVGDSDPSMTLVGRVLVVAGGGCGQESGLDRTTGALLWSENTNACFGGSQPVSSTNGIYLWAPADFGSPLVYDPASGAVLGEFSTDTPAFGYGEAVGVTNPGSATPGQLKAFDPASRAVRWSNAIAADSYFTMPVLADGFAFEAINPGSVASPDPGYVEALDACTGAPAWQGPLVSPLGSAVTSLAAGDGYLVVSGWSGLEAFKGSGMPPEPPPICNPAQLPAAATPPTITGAAQLGQLLSVSGATWSRSPLTFSYQWERCNAPELTVPPSRARTRRPTQSHLAMSVTQSVPPKPRLIPTARARRSPHPRPPLFCGHHHRHTRAPRPQASGPGPWLRARHTERWRGRCSER